MKALRRNPCHVQRCAAVRLRREAWGGLAFDRSSGDLLELDAEGFEVLAALTAPQTLRDLHHLLGRKGHRVRLPELAKFVKLLESRGLIRPAAAADAALTAEEWTVPAIRNDTADLRAPLVAHWAVTYRCNLQCSFCYSESGPHREAGPGAETRLRLVDRLADWGVLEVALGGGEPTILPDLPALLAAIRRAGLVPNVTTNGTLQHAPVLRALAEHAGVVHLSADRPELLDTARGEGVFARLRVTAQRLRAAGVRLGVNLLLTPHNVRDIGRSLEAAVELGVQAVTFLRPKGPWAAAHWPGFPSPDACAALATDLKAFLKSAPPLRLYVDTALRGEWCSLGLLDDPEPEVLGCGGGQRHVAVTPEGDVYPCSHARQTGYRMGNLLTDDFEQLWSKGKGRANRQTYLADCAGVQCACSRPGVVSPRGQGLLVHSETAETEA
jgi:MoaA/NifB/PqqE/SkfB family radical SAM enzyme